MEKFTESRDTDSRCRSYYKINRKTPVCTLALNQYENGATRKLEKRIRKPTASTQCQVTVGLPAKLHLKA